MNETMEKAMSLLLNNFWITKDKRRDDYYFLKQNLNSIKSFVSKNLGNRVIAHDRFIKLEKLPATPKAIFGISSFESSFDYVLLFISMLYLEDKPRGDKFILSDFLETVKNTAITLELNQIPNWDMRPHRKSMLRVLKFLEDTEVLWLLDRRQNKFEDDLGEALYETSGLANYLVPSFDYGIEKAKTAEDFLALEVNLDEEVKDIRRYKVYRNLIYTPAVMESDLKIGEEEYLKKMHKTIEEELRNNLNFDTEITKNMAICYAEESSLIKEYFPNSKKISDIILIINEEVVNELNIKHYERNPEECYHLEKSFFYSLLEDLRSSKKEYFSKELLNLSTSKYLELVINYLTQYCFIKEEEESFVFFPSIYRFIGKTSKENESVQLEMEDSYDESK